MRTDASSRRASRARHAPQRRLHASPLVTDSCGVRRVLLYCCVLIFFQNWMPSGHFARCAQVCGWRDGAERNLSRAAGRDERRIRAGSPQIQARHDECRLAPRSRARVGALGLCNACAFPGSSPGWLS